MHTDRPHRHTTPGPWRLAVCLRSGAWDSKTLRPSTRAGDITRFVTTLDLGTAGPAEPTEPPQPPKHTTAWAPS